MAFQTASNRSSAHLATIPSPVAVNVQRDKCLMTASALNQRSAHAMMEPAGRSR
jgi:hypothetical protein